MVIMTSTELALSIVVPAYNEADRLPESLRRIHSACDALPKLKYELIVCDNNSTDGTAAIASRAGCRVVFEPVNQISRARNRGASAATGDWLLFIDADSWPPPELMSDVEALIQRSNVIGAGSTIRVVDGPKWFRFAWQSKNWSMRMFKWCPGAFLLCRREAFAAIGGFSEEYFLFEELYFVKRLRALGRMRGERFIVLHKHPFHTSGRRAMSYRAVSWLIFALKLTFFHRRSIRDKDFAEKWYNAER